MIQLSNIGKQVKEASVFMRNIKTSTKNRVLSDAAKLLLENIEFILAENKKDLEIAKANGIKGSLLDRLTLTYGRVEAMAEGLQQVVTLDDPVGEVISMKTMQNGLVIGQKRVPIGVIGIIYDARPNVTADAFGLCFKAGSAVILRGGKEAIHSNKAIITIFQKALFKNELSEFVVQLIEDTSRETAVEMMKMNQYIDVLIPRGSAGLIQTVIQNSTIPVIETGIGNCHIFVDESADFNKAIDIIVNAKVQRPGVCNACEKLVIHEKVAQTFLPLVYQALRENNVVVKGDQKAQDIVPDIVLATEEDWSTEYIDYIIAVKIVDNFDEAIVHIQKYSTGHSEAILTESYQNSQRFLNEIDAACVYVNASTRFTDGGEFGFGAEIGISTQKLHARGPMGLKELTSTKYIIYGNGQIRI